MVCTCHFCKSLLPRAQHFCDLILLISMCKTIDSLDLRVLPYGKREWCSAMLTFQAALDVLGEGDTLAIIIYASCRGRCSGKRQLAVCYMPCSSIMNYATPKPVSHQNVEVSLVILGQRSGRCAKSDQQRNYKEKEFHVTSIKCLRHGA